MAKWIQLVLRFQDYLVLLQDFHNKNEPGEKPSGTYRELIAYLKSVVDSVSPDYIRRFFFTFQFSPDDAHLPLSLEVNNEIDIETVQNKIMQIQRPVFVVEKELRIDSRDEENGDVALDFYHATTKFTFYRITENYTPDYYKGDAEKLIHIFGNQVFLSREPEFYVRCLINRGFINGEAKPLQGEGLAWGQNINIDKKA